MPAPDTLSSAIYSGRLRHRRSRSPAHTFAMPVWHLLLDIDELAEIAARTPILGHNRFNLLTFDDRDHMAPAAGSVRAKLTSWLADRGIEPPLGRVLLLTSPRHLGHVFNPVSFYYLLTPAGALRHVVAEVNNTFGETFCYLLEGSPDPEVRVVHAEIAKVFHVSPFQPMSGSYRFRLTRPARRLVAHIEVLRDGRRAFDATLSSVRHPLTTGNLLRTLVRHSHMTARIVARIHFEALRLWIKGAPFHPKPDPPAAAWRTRHG